MPIGEVKKYIPDKGYGFIQNGSPNDSDIFFHITEFDGSQGAEPPKAGEEVSFTVKIGDKGLAAQDVRRVEA